MIVLLRADADAATVRDVVDRVEKLGLRAMPLEGPKGRALEVVGPHLGRALALRDTQGVQDILTRRTPLSGGEPVWPHFALRVGSHTLLLMALLGILGAYLPPGLGDPVGTGVAPELGVDWYLRPAAAFLQLFDGEWRLVGGSLALLLWLAFLFWPFLDRADARTPSGRVAVNVIRVFGAGVFLAHLVLALGVLS